MQLNLKDGGITLFVEIETVIIEEIRECFDDSFL